LVEVALKPRAQVEVAVAAPAKAGEIGNHE
jgi:hypothetical protein